MRDIPKRRNLESLVSHMRYLVLAMLGLVCASPSYAGAPAKQDCHLVKYGAAYNLICTVSPSLDPGHGSRHRGRTPDLYRDNTGIVPPKLVNPIGYDNSGVVPPTPSNPIGK